ncbi:hypothetical protein OHB53_12460 [Streptomyces sp. NBC_00056]|uniref:hypothetical protein n=1 Tax=unclassified Streptomyces TaxID=2593676 RepID=UPI002255FA74|nr:MULTISPECIES: hypothetical protein [unclassified Streptomyces]MCX5440752.1 hypothetical protein [Streptomyces sp. NBC_00063]WUB92878.1 hypothetical protein OHO83_11590 [Streptomyces sp. NBC_00569]
MERAGLVRPQPWRVAMPADPPGEWSARAPLLDPAAVTKTGGPARGLRRGPVRHKVSPTSPTGAGRDAGPRASRSSSREPPSPAWTWWAWSADPVGAGS